MNNMNEEMLFLTPNTGLFVGLNKGHVVTKKELARRPSDRKGEVDPCEELTDDDIRTTIQNATSPRSALFVPEMGHRCMVNELQRFPVLRKRMDNVIGNFLSDGLQPSETMIGHIVEKEMDYINTSHPNFVCGSKVVEVTLQQVKSSKLATTVSRQKDGVEYEKAPQSERGIKSRAILSRPVNGIATEQVLFFAFNF
ncbi:unnamed protein product [Lactuca saligna]|uniref:Dynamin stalk domain-containing protein n=1 Tax=Lactuca saligna TaxID=75948 RepID=A0AA35ZKD1_LACSI|nr:unnamed protein product [Lactuca saligna]